ncbi:transposase [Catenuloplanes nepalensis]|uniref:Transposase n=1 Tax=Catenuloplanes nepalensis TaxID=587533 RepID=A0ABT9MVG6_9ACTN|nr:ISL3 family transposase [Catenuloplanes nepalensis]MDP9791685.1 transposase [Catenuloplanes nepalensis]MDP9791941.1 transposase [Catenuloplanes nepalensis]MDP9794404.1 transposase [Catenuloplanes nepalensis]MDP9795256.1 transposase [Catenuloplanes nepalensis]MDP9796869.1 transposase [Catenuloplanes nepalensis]
MVNDTTRLLGLDGLVVDRVELDAAGVPVVVLSTGCEQARCCPDCGQEAVRVKAWVTTRPRDLPVAGRTVRLRWRKRRWHCPTDSCPRVSFTEQVGQVPARARLTGRLRAAAGAAVADGGRTVVQSARDHGLSWPVVAAAFTAHAAAVLPAEPDPVEVLGIDETRRGRPKWEFDPVTQAWQTSVDRWHVGMCDLTGGQGLLGQVEGRTAQTVIDWLTARSQDWRDQVRYVAIDMCTIFKSAITTALPHAILVVDHFHVVQLAHQALNDVRRRITVQHRGRRGRAGDLEWDLRNRLTRSARRLRAERVDKLCDDLTTLPAKISTPILAAWNAKEDLLDLLALARTHPNRETITRHLHRFYTRCADSGQPELTRLARTIETWWPQILAFLHTGITNAGSEGTNRVIKTVARNAYGFRNPENQRLRTRAATTRKSRGHLNPA